MVKNIDSNNNTLYCEKMSLLLPLLIQTTIDFYIWRVGIKSLHLEYKKRILVDENIRVIFVSDQSTFCNIYKKQIYKGNLICNISGIISIGREYIYSFNIFSMQRYKPVVVYVPRRFHYSSGMLDPHGYR